MQVVELEQRLVQAEAARIMRDHKLALFQAKEDDLVSELAERDARLEELEVRRHAPISLPGVHCPDPHRLRWIPPTRLSRTNALRWTRLLGRSSRR
jgi:hypothetical protein